jgi:branched-chain amino acid transport system substrate-binding protein
MRMKHRFLGSLAAAALAFSLGVVPAAGPAQEGPVDVDVIISLTGPGGFAGQANQKSLAVYEADVNAHGGIRGRPLHLVFHDDQTSPQLVVQLMNGIIARHPAVVVGPAFAALCNAVAPMVASGPVDYCLSPSIYPPKGSYVFSNGPSQADLIGAMVRYFRDRGIKRIAAITTTDATGQDADKALNDEFVTAENKRAGLVLSAHEHYNPTDIDVTAQIARMKSGNPGAVICWTSGTALGTFLRSVKQSGLEIPVGTSPSNMTRAQMTQYASILPQELYFSGAPFPVGLGANLVVRALVDDYSALIKKANIQADYQTGLAWDPMSIVVDALRRIGPNATAAQVRDYIGSLRGFAALDGIFDFVNVPQRGIDQSNLIVMKWEPKNDGWIAVTRVGGGLVR